MGKSVSKSVMEEEGEYRIKLGRMMKDLDRMKEQWPVQNSVDWDFQPGL